MNSTTPQISYVSEYNIYKINGEPKIENFIAKNYPSTWLENLCKLTYVTNIMCGFTLGAYAPFKRKVTTLDSRCLMYVRFTLNQFGIAIEISFFRILIALT